MVKPSKDERIKYKVDYPNDTAFSAYARLLQSKWRDSKGFPEGKAPERKRLNGNVTRK